MAYGLCNWKYLWNFFGVYKRFIQTSKWFYAPQIHVSNMGQWIYSYNNPQADYRIIRSGAGVDFGYAIDRFSEVRAGYEIGYLNANLKLGTPEFSSVKGGVGDTRFRFITDHLDEPIVPSAGYFGQMNFHFFDKSPGAPSAFPNLEMKTEFFKPMSPKVPSFWWHRVGRPWATSKLAFLSISSAGRRDF